MIKNLMGDSILLINKSCLKSLMCNRIGANNRMCANFTIRTHDRNDHVMEFVFGDVKYIHHNRDIIPIEGNFKLDSNGLSHLHLFLHMDALGSQICVDIRDKEVSFKSESSYCSNSPEDFDSYFEIVIPCESVWKERDPL